MLQVSVKLFLQVFISSRIICLLSFFLNHEVLRKTPNFISFIWKSSVR